MSVELHRHRLEVDGRPVPLLSGQVDYWLHPAPFWPRILDAVRDIGLDQVSCYVPWNYHRLDDGTFDFEGRTDPTRDLAGFLDLAAAAGLTALLRPGPWVYTFWADGGVPVDASAFHRLHPGFLAPARAYLRALAPVVVPRLASNGGPIVLVQVDNEIEPLATQRGDSGGTRIPDDPVGTSYGAQLLDGGLDDPFTLPSFLAARGLPRTRETVLEYYRWYCTQYAHVMADELRRLGVDVPLALNVFANGEPQSDADFARLAEVVGGDYWGFDHLPWDQAMLLSRHVRHLRATTGTPWSAELQSVTIAQFVSQGIEDVVTPDNARYLALLGMCCGLKGWNWYTIAERSSLYFAPINAFGGRVPGYFEAFAQVHDLFRRVDWPTFEPLTDAALWFDRFTFRDQVRFARPLDEPFFAITESGGGSWAATFDRLSRLDVDLDLHDPEAACNAPVDGRAVVVAPVARMRAADQDALLRLAHDEGAALVFLGAPPAADEAGAPTATFAAVAAAPPGAVVPLGAGRAVALPGSAGDESLLAALAALGAPRAAASGAPGVLSSVWERDDERLVVAVNTTGEPYAGPLRLDVDRLGLDPASPYLVERLLAGTSAVLPAAGLAALPLTLAPHDGETVRLTPAPR